MSAFLSFLHRYWLAVAMLCVIGSLALLEPASGQWLRFDRNAIAAGQWWRLLTAHWVHLSPVHAASNSAGVLLCAYIAGADFSRRATLVFLLFSLMFVGLSLWWLAGDLYYYVGLSGVLHGLLLVSVATSRYYDRRIQWLIALVIIGKVIWEQTTFYDDGALRSLIGGRVETRAHLAGLISGLLWLAGRYYLSLRKHAHDG
ncbi:rhombosortase [Thalassolituus sp. LLYu03]|uniref:rhombosortase n=1 Tax=Thalassolituus sp. LLYu03 TaxID=3421656 RepID=UPI003D27E6E7